MGKKLKLTPSYISRVANGKRENPKIKAALLTELRKLQLAGARAKSVLLAANCTVCLGCGA